MTGEALRAIAPLALAHLMFVGLLIGRRVFLRVTGAGA